MSPLYTKKDRKSGFTLVEILVVLVIMSVLAGLTVSAFNSVSDSQGFASQTSDFQQLLNDARAYAMANNTYVFVGMQEVDASQSSSAVPQVQATSSTGGRIGVAVVATKDGTTSLTGANAVVINKLKVFSNLHIQPTYYMGSSVTASNPSPLANRVALSNSQYSVGTNATSNLSFTWPLTGTAQYTFNQVLQFSPDGATALVGPTKTLTPTWLEIDLEQTHGPSLTSLPVYSSLNSALVGHQVAAIQIDGITGHTQVYQQ